MFHSLAWLLLLATTCLVLWPDNAHQLAFALSGHKLLSLPRLPLEHVPQVGCFPRPLVIEKEQRATFSTKSLMAALYPSTTPLADLRAISVRYQRLPPSPPDQM